MAQAMPPPLSPTLPEAARPVSLRPSCLGKRAQAALVEQDLKKALEVALDTPACKTESISEQSTNCPSLVSTAVSSESPSRRGSVDRDNMPAEAGSRGSLTMLSLTAEEVVFQSPTLPSPFRSSRATSCAPGMCQERTLSDSTTRRALSSRKTPRRARQRIMAEVEAAKRRAPHGTPVWRRPTSVDARELSLPCVEVGYWSVWELGRTDRGKLANHRQEEIRREARRVLSTSLK